jgi:hypothetical protein
MSRTWKIYTGNPVDPSCLTLQSGLPSPLSLLAEVEARETPDIISYLPSYGYLFCTLCRSAIPRKVLPNHLQRHHNISSRLSTAILRRYEHLPVAQEDSDIVLLPNESRVLPFLAASVRGYSCPHCIWLTVNWSEFTMDRAQEDRAILARTIHPDEQRRVCRSRMRGRASG